MADHYLNQALYDDAVQDLVRDFGSWSAWGSMSSFFYRYLQAQLHELEGSDNEEDLRQTKRSTVGRAHGRFLS